MESQPEQAGVILPIRRNDSSDMVTVGGIDMSTREERLMILRMVEEGKISPEEGAKLLAALGDDQGQTGQADAGSFDMSRMLRIRVSDTVTGQQKVNVNIPIGFVRFGLRFVPDCADVDSAAILAALDSGVKGRIVDVVAEEDGKHVEIFVE